MRQSRTTQAARRQATRGRLLEAAFNVFAAQGYTGATVDAIVQAAGYSKGAFYFHFSSKEEVFLEVLWARARTEEQTLRSAGDAASGRPLDLLRAVAGFLGPGNDDTLWPPLLLEFWSHAARNPRVREGVAMALQRWGDADFGAVLDEVEGWRDGDLYEQRAIAAAVCEPRLLKERAQVKRVLKLLDGITRDFSKCQQRKSDEFIVLKKGLSYCWSVATAA